MAAEFVQKRSAAVKSAPRNLSEKCLLTGIVYCGVCGAPCHVNTTGRKDVRYFRYHCYYRNKYSDRCAGPAGYNAGRIDRTIDQLMHGIFSKFTDSPADYSLEIQFKNKKSETEVMLKKARATLDKIQKSLATLKGEVARSLTGESAFTPEILSESIREYSEKENLMLPQISRLENELQNSKAIMDEIVETNNLVKDWADCYSDSPPKTKSTIVSHFIEKVVVHPGYKLDIYFKLSKSQFLGESSELEDETLGVEQHTYRKKMSVPVV
jgi:hypothetical protein